MAERQGDYLKTQNMNLILFLTSEMLVNLFGFGHKSCLAD